MIPRSRPPTSGLVDDHPGIARGSAAERNRRVILDAIHRARQAGADLLVLPELANSGYVATRAQATTAGESIPSGALIRAMREAISSSPILVAVGLCESGPDGVFDAAVLLDSSGVLLHYRKAHLWRREAEVFDSGDLGFPIVKTRIGTVGLLVCFDLWFPEALRLQVLAGAEVICVPSAWDAVPGRYYEDDVRVYLAASQAHMNEAIVVCADRVGSDEGCTFVGRSTVCDPMGVLAGPAASDSEDWLYAEASLARVRELRAQRSSGHLASRRTDLYSLTEVERAAPAAH
jgi:predicted amidohydrolase